VIQVLWMASLDWCPCPVLPANLQLAAALPEFSLPTSYFSGPGWPVPGHTATCRCAPMRWSQCWFCCWLCCWLWLSWADTKCASQQSHCLRHSCLTAAVHNGLHEGDW